MDSFWVLLSLFLLFLVPLGLDLDFLILILLGILMVYLHFSWLPFRSFWIPFGFILGFFGFFFNSIGFFWIPFRVPLDYFEFLLGFFFVFLGSSCIPIWAPLQFLLNLSWSWIRFGKTPFALPYNFSWLPLRLFLVRLGLLLDSF